MTTMKGHFAEKHLLNYKQKTSALLNKYFAAKVNQAKKIGVEPAELVEKFWSMAGLGKKLRGSLLVLGYQLSGGKDLSAIYQASLFLEIFQTAVLIHDDIMDDDTQRRGMATIHTLYEPIDFGRAMAINAGDLGFYFSMDQLLHSGFKEAELIRALGIYTDYVLRVIYGQVLDVSNKSFNDISQIKILKILRYKTAEYTGVLPLLVGAALAGQTDPKKLSCLKKYGLALGWAFQIQDDILGVFSDEKVIGKSIGSDLSQGKLTVLLAYFLDHAGFEEVNEFKKLAKDGYVNKEKIERMRHLLKKAGAYDYSVKLGSHYVSQGKKYINQITSDKKLRELLHSLIDFTMNRAL